MGPLVKHLSGEETWKLFDAKFALSISLLYHKELILYVGCGEAPNPLRMVVDRPNREELVRYTRAREHQVLHRAAAKLWVHGVNINTALKIVKEAVSHSRG